MNFVKLCNKRAHPVELYCISLLETQMMLLHVMPFGNYAHFYMTVTVIYISSSTIAQAPMPL